MSKFHLSILIFLLIIGIAVVGLFQNNIYLLLIFLGIFSIVYLCFLLIMSMAIRLNFFIKAIHQNSSKNIVLTFDDGPHPENTIKILNILDQYQAKAIFFMVGEHVDAHPSIAREVVARGHQVGIHSNNHQLKFGFLPAKKLQSDIENCIKAIEKATGVKTTLFRPPFGVTNPNVARIVKLMGLTMVGWNLRSFDTKFITPNRLINHVVRQVKAGSIVLLHDRLANTCEALPEIMNKIIGMGFAFGSLKNHDFNSK